MVGCGWRWLNGAGFGADGGGCWGVGVFLTGLTRFTRLTGFWIGGLERRGEEEPEVAEEEMILVWQDNEGPNDGIRSGTGVFWGGKGAADVYGYLEGRLWGLWLMDLGVEGRGGWGRFFVLSPLGIFGW